MQNIQPYPNIRQAFWLLIYLELIMLALFVVVEGIGYAAGLELIGQASITILIYLTAFLLALFIGTRRAGKSLRQLFPIRPVRPALLLSMLVTLVGAVFLISEVNNIIVYFFPMPEWLVEGRLRLIGAQGSFLIFFFLVAVLAPVAEEGLFRGLILGGFLKRYGVRKAMVASAILFAVFHLDPWSFFTTGALGLLFAWWFTRTRSLLPCILGHAIYNGVPSLLIFLLDDAESLLAARAQDLVFQPLSVDILALLIFTIGVWSSQRLFPQGPELKDP